MGGDSFFGSFNKKTPDESVILTSAICQKII